MKAKDIKVTEYEIFASGGGIDCVIGKGKYKKQDVWFLGDATFPSIVVVNSDCYDMDVSFYDDWQQAHLVGYLDDDQSKEFVDRLRKEKRC